MKLETARCSAAVAQVATAYAYGHDERCHGHSSQGPASARLIGWPSSRGMELPPELELLPLPETAVPAGDTANQLPPKAFTP
jgi:hypothetical protein